MNSPSLLIVRPEPSRGLGAFYRNLGMTMLAAHARACGLDPHLADLTFDDFDEALGCGATVAAFSLYIDDFARGIELAAAARKAGLVTVAGGPHVTLLGQDVLAATDAFDLIGVGDCLAEAMPVIAGIARGGVMPASRIIGAGAEARMDALAPDYRIWPDGRYFPVFPVEFSRGCRQHCPFCTDPVLRRGVATDPAERTMATLKDLVARHGRIWVRFVDSSMSSLGPDLDRLLEAMTAAGLPIEWGAYAYPHDIDAGLAARMARAGCRALFLGIESLAGGVRVGKHHAKHPGEVARAVDTLHEQGIFVHGNFIIGLPGETAATVQETLAGLARIRFDSIGGGPFFLTPGSTFERRPDKFGIRILDPAWRIRQHVNFYDPEHAYFATGTLTQAQIRALAGGFRRSVEDQHLGCWNLSDYALLCWLSADGDVKDLTRPVAAARTRAGRRTAASGERAQGENRRHASRAGGRLRDDRPARGRPGARSGGGPVRILAICRGAPGLGRVVPSLALTQALAARFPVTGKFASYQAGARYLAARGEDVVDLGRPDGLFIDSVSPQALRATELAEQDAPDLVLIDGEFFLPATLAHLHMPVVYLANPHDLTGEPNTFRRVNRLLLAHADAVLIPSLTCARPALRPELVPGTPCLEVPAITKDIPLDHQLAGGPPRVLVSTGGGSLRAGPGFRAATDAALACVLDALAEQAVLGAIAKVTVVLGADAGLTGTWRHPPGWLQVTAGPVELAGMYPHHDLLIARAGRNTAAEAAYCGIPAILLPVTADPHRGSEQAANAAALAHLPGIFTTRDWQELAALRQTLRRALRHAGQQARVTGHRGNDSAAAFIAGLVTSPGARNPLTIAS